MTMIDSIFSVVEKTIASLSKYDFLIGKAVSIAITIIAVFFVYKILVSAMKRWLLSNAKTKHENNDALMVIKFWKYILFFFGVLTVIFVSTGSFAAFGVSAGLFTAALGWALQRPITGIAGWIMVMVKKPFKIGDRILIDAIRGDVVDITLTHVYLKELGGIISGEETSGRTILVPNSILFEKNIINYSLNNKYIRDQVKVQVTYESDLHKAKKLAVKAAKEVLGKETLEETDEPYALTYFADSGINMYIRYQVPAEKLQKMGAEITQKIYDHFKEHKDIQFAYPHRAIVRK
ncbi:MAG: mechanosensitive ion channel family protein [Candidatus Woesearchaeota archaeon]